MTDKQLQNLYDSISDFEDFIIKANSRQDIITEKIKISFIKDQVVNLVLPGHREKVSIEDFEKVKNELHSQWTSDKGFEEIKKNKIYDLEINIRDNKTFILTDEFIKKLLSGRDISSGYNWYRKQIRTILTLFTDGYTLIHNDNSINDKKVFSDRYLKGLYGFESLEKELE